MTWSFSRTSKCFAVPVSFSCDCCCGDLHGQQMPWPELAECSIPCSDLRAEKLLTLVKAEQRPKGHQVCSPGGSGPWWQGQYDQLVPKMLCQRLNAASSTTQLYTIDGACIAPLHCCLSVATYQFEEPNRSSRYHARQLHQGRRHCLPAPKEGTPP
jgi:hypothetical protein